MLKNLSVKCFSLTILILFSMFVSLPYQVNAEGNISDSRAIEVEIDEIRDTGNYDGPRLTGPDDMGYTQWNSFYEARNYYGRDFTYHYWGYCNNPGGGGGSCYLYFYNFGEGGRMYFGVKP